MQGEKEKEMVGDRIFAENELVQLNKKSHITGGRLGTRAESKTGRR